MREPQSYTPEEIVKLIDGKLLRNFGRESDTATKVQLYKAVCLVVRDIMSELWLEDHDLLDSHMQKQVYYLSMEFLPGPSLKNNLFNLGIEDIVSKAVASIDGQLDELCEMEPDAGLGNGGLGRLASCYLDAIASNRMAGHGFSICYEYGIFKQKIKDCCQKEEADDWLTLGDVWLIRKEEETEEVRFGGNLREVWDDHG
ncbi:MAG: glycogen/starch/alpha-glucan phosphorylase, partial [Anaerovorax sp.]